MAKTMEETMLALRRDVARWKGYIQNLEGMSKPNISNMSRNGWLRPSGLSPCGRTWNRYGQGPEMNSRERLLKICHHNSTLMRRALRMMESGMMQTRAARGGQMEDTTVETMAEYSAAIVELEATIASIEGHNA